MLVLAALMMVILLAFLGLVVDVGRLFVVRQELRAACDAAAMAGASQLPFSPTKAREEALTYYLANRGGTLAVNPVPDDTEMTVSGPGDVIKVKTPYLDQVTKVYVSASTNVPSFFMQLVGVPNTVVGAYAVAIGQGRKAVAAAVVSSYSGGRSQPLARYRDDGQRYAIVIEGNNLILGVDGSGEVVAPTGTSQNLYIDTNNTIGTAVYGDDSGENYIKTNDKTSEGMQNPTSAQVAGSFFLDPNYYLTKAQENSKVFNGNVSLRQTAVSGFYFVYGDLYIGKNVTGTATFAATGKITIGESSNSLTTADTENHLLFFAGANPSLNPATYFEAGSPDFNPDAYSIFMDDNNSTYHGSFYAPYGYIMNSSNSVTITGAFIADGLAITQYSNGLTVTYDSAFAPATSPGARLTE